MSQRFRAVGSQNLTGDHFSQITVNAQSVRVLGHSPSVGDLPSLDALQTGAQAPGAKGVPLAASSQIAGSAAQTGLSAVQWASNAYSGQTDTSQDAQQGGRATSGIADTVRGVRKVRTQSETTTAPTSAGPEARTGRPGPSPARGEGGVPKGGTSAPGGRETAATKRPVGRGASGGRGSGKVGVRGGPRGARLLQRGPGAVRTARGIRPAAGVVVRAGATNAPTTTVASTGRVTTRAAGTMARGSAQVATRLALIIKQAALTAAKGTVAAAASPTTWLVAGVAALILVLLLAVGQLISGASAGLAGSQQETGACIGPEVVPEQGQAWLSEAVAASGLPANFLARVISRESDWRPDTFAMDSNGGTWGLFQINRLEWSRLYPASVGRGAGAPLGITDPMLHARLGGLLMKQNYDTAVRLQTENPTANYAQIDPLEAAVIIHNAGQGALIRYPNIPAITKDYVAEVMAGGGGPGTWTHPAPTGTLTSTFGSRRHPVLGYHRLHAGIDFASGPGSPIYAANSGTVTFAGFDSVGTGTIHIDHGEGIKTVYLHMYPGGIHVRTGETVTGGQVIGAEGSSGYSTGSHLHFEVHQNGIPIDPLVFLEENLGQLSAGIQACAESGITMIAGGTAPVVQTAMSFIGVPYVWGGSTPAGFDCSGLMVYAYGRHGVTLPRVAHQQAFFGQNIYAGAGFGADIAALQPGDLIAFSNSGGANYQHIGMYVGGGQMVHAPVPGKSVEVVPLDSWKGQIWRVQRVATGDA